LISSKDVTLAFVKIQKWWWWRLYKHDSVGSEVRARTVFSVAGQLLLSFPAAVKILVLLFDLLCLAIFFLIQGRLGLIPYRTNFSNRIRIPIALLMLNGYIIFSASYLIESTMLSS
jgi:hypothetical protein